MPTEVDDAEDMETLSDAMLLPPDRRPMPRTGIKRIALEPVLPSTQRLIDHFIVKRGHVSIDDANKIIRRFEPGRHPLGPDEPTGKLEITGDPVEALRYPSLGSPTTDRMRRLLSLSESTALTAAGTPDDQIAPKSSM